MKSKKYIDPTGVITWYIGVAPYNMMLHREDGPAVVLPTGYKYWWFMGKHINCSSQKEFERLLRLKAFW